MGQHLVDSDGWEVRDRILPTGRSPPRCARTPLGRVGPRPRHGLLIHHHQRKTKAVRQWIPSPAIGEVQNLLVCGIQQSDPLPPILQKTVTRPRDIEPGSVALHKGGWITRNHYRLPRGKKRCVGEGEGKPVRKMDPLEVQRHTGADVPQLNELKLLSPVGRAGQRGWIEHQFRHPEKLLHGGGGSRITDRGNHPVGRILQHQTASPG